MQEASSFDFLAPYGPLYLRLATVAERALAVDPSLPLYRDRIALVCRYDVPPTVAIRVVIDELSAHTKVIC